MCGPVFWLGHRSPALRTALGVNEVVVRATLPFTLSNQEHVGIFLENTSQQKSKLSALSCRVFGCDGENAVIIVTALFP